MTIPMNDNTDVGALALLAGQASEPKLLETGRVFQVPDGSGGVRVIDTDAFHETPRHNAAARTVTDAASFVAYLAKHGLAQSEVWAHTSTSAVVAIIDAHQGAEADAGWEKHRLTLALEKSKPWLAWIEADGAWFEQDAFAEFIEQRAVDVVEPDYATLIELAQRFEATKSVDFESGTRRDNGQVRLEYTETVNARAGQRGEIDIPTTLKLALTPYVGGPRYAVFARFRYRLNGSNVKLGFVLERPHDILDGAFADIVTEIRDGKTVKVGEVETRVHDGITQPIFYGRP